MFRQPRVGGECEWGTIDEINFVAEGIYLVGTPSHGGFILAPDRMAMMREKYRKLSFTGDNHFEEDEAWVGVVLSFPECFSEKLVKNALSHYQTIKVDG